MKAKQLDKIKYSILRKSVERVLKNNSVKSYDISLVEANDLKRMIISLPYSQLRCSIINDLQRVLPQTIVWGLVEPDSQPVINIVYNEG